MSDKVDIRALAKLARLEVSDAEVEKLEREIPSILSFVESIQKAPASKEKAPEHLKNVMRADAEPHEGGIYTENLLAAAPALEGNRVAVKQVISRAEIFREQSDHKNPSAVSKKAAKK